MLNVERKMKCMVSTFLIMCFVCSGFAGISSPYSDTQTGTYGLWHLDSQSGGVIADDSGSDLLGRSNAANLVGGAAIVTPGVYPSGNSAFGDAVKLSAIGDYVEIDAGLNPYFNQENVRVEMWINMESSQANGNYCLANLDPFRFYVQAVDTSTGDYNLMLQVIQTDNTYGLTTTADLPDIAAAWTHVAFEYTADNDTGKLYVNGSLAAEQEGISEGIGLRSFRYRRFGTYSATGDTFIGMIDEIRVSSAVEPDTDVLAPYSDQAVGNAALLHMDSASGGFVDDDDSADLLARGNDGQLIGNAQIVTPGDYPAGNSAFGNAMSASAMGDYLEFPALIDEFSTNDGRIEAWIKLDSPVATGPHYIAMLNPYRFYINYGSGAYYLGLLLVKSNGAATAYYTVPIPDITDKWVHCSCEYDIESDTAKMYLNGVMVKAVPGITGGIGLQAVVNYRRVGTYSSASQPLLGKIDELRLSQATQINTDFLSPYDDTLKGTVGLWHMDSAVGSSVSDDDSVALTPRGNDMDYVGPVQLVSPSAYPAGNSQFANAAQFNGYSSYLEAGQITGFDQDNVRVECWAKLHPDVTDGGFYLANLDPLRIYVNMSAGKFYFNVVPIKTNNLAAPKVACEVPDLIDNWVHLAVEYLKSTDTMKLFVNGRLCSTYVALTEGSGLRNLSQKRIGTYSPTSYVFWGWIDDFRITNAVMPELVCGDLGYVPADLNEDCFVDIVDLEILVSDWLESTMPQ